MFELVNIHNFLFEFKFYMDVFFEDCFQKCFTVPLYDVQKRENKTEKSLNRSYIFIEKFKRVLDEH